MASQAPTNQPWSIQPEPADDAPSLKPVTHDAGTGLSEGAIVNGTPIYFTTAPRARTGAHELKWGALPWRQLVDGLLARVDYRPAGKDGKLSGPMISPATFVEGGAKTKDNVTGVHWLMLDFDDIEPGAFTALLGSLEHEGLAAFAYSTWQHPDAAARGLIRARVGMPLTRPCNSDEWTRVYRAALAKWGASGAADTSCSDPSRMYFTPSQPVGTEAVAFTWRAACFDQGLAVDPDALVRDFGGTETVDVGNHAPALGTDPIPRDALVRFTAKLNRSLKSEDLRVAQLMRNGLDGHAFAITGDRHRAKLELTWRIAQQFPRGNAVQIADHFRPSLDLMRDGSETEDPHAKFVGLIESAQRKIQLDEARKQLEVANDRRRVISLLSTQLEDIGNAAIEELATLDVFQRSGGLVHVTRDAVPDKIVRPGGAPSIRDLPRERIRELLDRRVRFETRREDGNIVAVPPPYEIVNAIAVRGEWPHIRPLRGIVNFPVMRPDGSLLDAPGYDLATATLSNTAVTLAVPSNPTQADAQQAARTLLELVGDFPFQDDAARAVWLAALLTPLARTAIDGPVPLTILDANARGAGKTLLASIIGRIVLGADLPMRTAPETQEEWRKALFAIVLAGDPLVLIDNVTRMVQSSALDSILTSTTYGDRVLGLSQERTIQVRTSFLLSSNNARLSSDLVRRSLHCRLEAAEERPEQRSGFRYPSVLAQVTEQRTHYLTAALTILRAHVVAGRPATGGRPMGSFESWSRNVAAPLIWLGLPDPVSTQDALRDGADVERDEVGSVLRAWFDLFPAGNSITAREVVEAAEAHTLAHLSRNPGADPEADRLKRQALHDALAGLFDGKDGERLPSSAKLGYRLRTLRGVIVGGLVLHKDGAIEGSTKWKVKRVGT